MTKDEQEMIQQPLARIMARMSPEASEAIDKWTDPILLAVGFGLYLARVFSIVQRESQEKKHVAAQKKASPQPNHDDHKPANDASFGLPVGVPEYLKVLGET